MKICPKCQKTYNDENLNFCLDDGSVLAQGGSQPGNDSLPETVMMSSPRPTAPNQQVDTSSPPSWGHQQPSVPTWSAAAQPAKGKSKSWLWVLGILAGVVVLCGGGIVGMAVLLASVDTEESNSTTKTNIDLGNRTISSDDSAKFSKVDLSGWTKVNPEYAAAEYENGELVMGTKEKRYYYVLIATSQFKTDDATTRVTVRNVDEEPTDLGYGLIFHSDPEKPLVKDYAFLIDASKKRYRIVKHSPGKETDLVKWTRSAVIKDGTQKNVLEVRDSNGDISLFINGQKVDSIKNSDGYGGGVAGIYSGGGIPVAFSDLEIGK
ncbi:MAG: hypothetical protein KIS76_09500 [Pyrinomonadaceae bacterium]|nr:hypothetical protein [Pyrinomonadaceae bacterium]